MNTIFFKPYAYRIITEKTIQALKIYKTCIDSFILPSSSVIYIYINKLKINIYLLIIKKA